MHLGADVDATEGRKNFDAASERLQAVGEKLGDKKLGDKKIIVTSLATDILYVSDPTKSPDLSYYAEELGLPLVQPEGVKKADYFESLSWVNADKYGGDITMYDARVGAAGLKIHDAQPTWQTVAGGQVRSLRSVAVGLTPELRGLRQDHGRDRDGLQDQL